MKTLHLNGRYYAHRLEEISSTDDTIDFVFKSDTQYMRVSSDKNNKIIFIDPEGGPLIDIGFKVDNMEVIDIKQVPGQGFVLTMKK